MYRIEQKSTNEYLLLPKLDTTYYEVVFYKISGEILINFRIFDLMEDEYLVEYNVTEDNIHTVHSIEISQLISQVTEHYKNNSVSEVPIVNKN